MPPLCRARITASLTTTVLLTAALSVISLIDPAPLMAQQGRTTQIVILNVPKGGTRTLAEALSDLPDVALFPQRWFEEQLAEQEVESSGIFDRPEELSQVMAQSNVDLVLRLRYSSKQQIYRVDVITRAQGLSEYSFEVDGSEEGLDESGAAQVRQDIEDFLANRAAAQRPRTTTDPFEEGGAGDGGEEPFDPNSLRENAIAQQNQKTRRPGASKKAAQVRAGFRLIEPTLLITGGRIQSLSATAGGTPGFAVEADVLPMALVGGGSPQAENFGISLSYSHVFKKIGNLLLADEMGAPIDNTKVTVASNYFDFRGGVFYRIFSDGSQDGAHIRLKGGVRINKFNLAQPVVGAFPFGFFSLMIGAEGVHPIGTTGASLLANVEIAPFSKALGAWEETIGAVSYSYALGGGLGLSYDFLPNAGFSARYSFDTYRLLFTGEIPVGGTEAVKSKGIFSANGLFAGFHYTY